MTPPTQQQIDSIYQLMMPPHGLELADAAARTRVSQPTIGRWLREAQRDDGDPMCVQLWQCVLEAESRLKGQALRVILDAVEEGSISEAKWLLRNRCGLSEAGPAAGLQELTMSGQEMAEPGTLESLRSSLRDCQMLRRAAYAKGSHVAAQKYMEQEVRLQEMVAEAEARQQAEEDAARAPAEVLDSIAAVVMRLPVTLRAELLAKLDGSGDS